VRYTSTIFRNSLSSTDFFDSESLKIFHGESIPFSSFPIDARLKENLKNNFRIEISTNIQALSLPEILRGKDVVIGAETGSGKTLAYLVPLFHQLLQEKIEVEKGTLSIVGPRDNDWSHIPELEPYKNEDYPRAIVLAPNKELCRQIFSFSQMLSDVSLLRVEHFVGASLTWPFHIKRPAPAVLICTPVFLASFHRNLALFSRLHTIIFDEADMLLDGGYLNQVDVVMTAFRRIEKMKQTAIERYSDSYKDGEMWLPKRTQRVLAAATLPTSGLKSVDACIKKYFAGAVTISNTLLHKHHPRLQQHFIKISTEKNEKITSLLELLVQENNAKNRIMVFVNTAAFASEVNDVLCKKGVVCVPYHKEVLQDQRETNLNAFKSGEIQVLVCTDLASRGLDIPNVSHVIQLEFATNVVQHLHRIGRAARAGRSGKAIAFYDENSEQLVQSILAAGEGELDKSFSRRRGLRKKFKRYGNSP